MARPSATSVAKPYTLAKSGAQYTLLKAGVIKVERHFPNLIEPWAKQEIPDYLAAIDHSLAIAEESAYHRALKREQNKLNHLARQLKDAGKRLVVVLQGRDGAGKGGTTKRIEAALGHDHKIFASVPIGPPTEEEKEHDFLWRFHKHDRMPGYGQVRVFDRSWYERVLVEKVMEFTDKDILRASYGHIRTFEWMLVESGAILVKIWLDITKDEQLRRFKRRQERKPWKVSKHDYVARKHWEDYTPTANEMFYRTGTDFAPWYIVSSEDKYYARVTALKLINQALRKALAQPSPGGDVQE